MAKSRNIVGVSTYQRIKRDIIFGELAPGSKLKLDGLRERYQASMSTLRETLNRLASEGFVDALDQRGFFVTPVSREDLIEIANLRVLLECRLHGVVRLRRAILLVDAKLPLPNRVLDLILMSLQVRSQGQLPQE